MKASISKEGLITKELRDQILSGQLSPGSRLPTRADLEKQYGAATLTVHRAVSRLMRDGFLVARGRLGTFVSQRSPHLHHYGLVMSFDPTYPLTEERLKFQLFLHREAVACRKKGLRNISTYHDVNGHIDSEDYHRLLDHVRAHRLAGLIFDACTFLETPPLADLLEVPGLPCVAVGGGFRSPAENRQHPNLTTIHLGNDRLIDRALDYLRARGRQRVALIDYGYQADIIQYFVEAVGERGMTTRPYWIQGPAAPSSPLTRNCARLLMELEPAKRPDALLIRDDSLVEHATTGLVDAGVRVPQELEVVAHCNYPHVTPSVVRAKRIGYDVREVLQACLDVIDRRRRGESVPPVVEIDPLFEEEVQAVATTVKSARKATVVANRKDWLFQRKEQANESNE